jgi:Ca2+-binding EF-hand superfamily protein
MKSSASQLEKLREVFLHLDVNKDGKLSFSEMKNGLDMLYKGSNYSLYDYKAIINAIDKDQNGFVDY